MRSLNRSIRPIAFLIAALACCFGALTKSATAQDTPVLRGKFNGKTLPQFFDQIFRFTGKSVVLNVDIDFRQMSSRFKFEAGSCGGLELIDTGSQPKRIIAFPVDDEELRKRWNLKEYFASIRSFSAHRKEGWNCGSGDGKFKLNPPGTRGIVIHPIG